LVRPGAGALPKLLGQPRDHPPHQHGIGFEHAHQLVAVEQEALRVLQLKCVHDTGRSVEECARLSEDLAAPPHHQIDVLFAVRPATNPLHRAGGEDEDVVRRVAYPSDERAPRIATPARASSVRAELLGWEVSEEVGSRQDLLRCHLMGIMRLG
jgi:hypothetical protein